MTDATTAAATDTPDYDIARLRARIPLLRTTIPMNACSHAPLTDATRAATLRFLDSWDAAGMDWDAWLTEVAAARAQFARLIGAAPEEVAVTTSVSAAAAGVASALDFGNRNVVVASGAEFPTVGHVWRAQERHGARVRWVPVTDGVIETDAYDDVLDDRVRVVSACHGYYQNGWKQDIAAIAHRAHHVGALIFVDAYQTAGTEPIDVKALGVDFLAAGCLKFLMGVPGIAFLYVRPELHHRLEPTVTGWFGRADPMAFDAATLDWASDARRFETGTPPILPAYVARAGMALLEEAGLDRIAAWTRRLSQALADGGQARGLRVHGPPDPARRTPTTAFACADAHRVEELMRSRGVIASARGPAIRLAPHFFNTLDDVDRALDVLADALREADGARG